MSEPVTRKRARMSFIGDVDSDAQNATSGAEESGQSNSLASRTRDEEFWYSDGNIILIAGNIEFRIYKGLLAENSPVFRDMFSLPQPATSSSSPGAPVVDACPVVHLFDSPEARSARVHAQKQCEVSSFSPADPTYDSIAAAVRLGHKYQMTTLLQQAVDYLKKYYTDDFNTWGQHTRYAPPGFQDVHSIGVVNLVRLTGETSMLPVALFQCCQLDADVLVQGFAREDGTREQLTLSDITLCIAAKTRLINESMRVLFKILRSITADECGMEEDCRVAFERLLRNCEKHISAAVSTDPLQFPMRFYRETSGKENLCDECYFMADMCGMKQKRVVWGKLPELLGISAEVKTWGKTVAVGGEATLGDS